MWRFFAILVFFFPPLSVCRVRDVGFAVSALASNWERLGKPFNPLLGETYEYKNSDFRVICEQVKLKFSFFHFPYRNVGALNDDHSKCDLWIN